MKKLILNSQNPIVRKLALVARVLGVAACFIFANAANGQVDCNQTMACNDGLQVSLDEVCEVIITPDMILEDPAFDNSEYTVILTDQNGVELPNATVDGSYINQTLSVNVKLNGCAAACWGSITIEDKLPPVFSTCENFVLSCDADVTPGGGSVPFPTLTDACGAVSDVDYTDVEVTNACANDFVKTITRSWTATDESGNEATCEQIIFIQKATITDVVFPPNYDDFDLPSFSCDVTLDLLPNGAPSPTETGFPSGATCPNIQTYYTDIIFEICGASKKILRQWVVVDWCTGEEVTDNQIIKILDTQAPICTATVDFGNEIPTDEGLCSGTYEVPLPIVIFECSDWSYNVGYRLRDEDGNPFEDQIFDNITYDASTNLFTISELPVDTSWIVYTLTDACGNVSQCFTEVVVVDTEAPTPVCEGFTVVSVEESGWADIFATSIDDGSFDNCKVDRFEVRRETTSCAFPSDLQFGEKVNFCCEDVGAGYIKVVLRVFDEAGNFNDCVVNVTVQDKINPTITCPSNVTIQCTQDFEDLNLTGEAVGFDNCSVVVTHTDNVNLDECGKGVVTRTWRATDAQGRTATCNQTISVVDSNPFSSNNITWPNNLNLNGCDAAAASPEEINSFPGLSNTDCTNIAISYDDDVFYNTPDFCIKVLRHWRIVDWCNYDPQNPTFFEFTQTIGFFNDVAPTFESCEDQSFTSTNGDCQEEVSLSVAATDDCTPDAQLKYFYSLDVDNNGSVDYNGPTNNFTRTLTVGTHKVTWSVIDACDNESLCVQFITVQDTKAPTPICLGEVVWVINEDGNAEVWARDFDLKSEAACGSDSDLIFSFNEAGTQQALTFTCADISNGIAEEIPLQMWVIDASGNSEFCDVTLILQDSETTNVCLDQEGGRASVGGNILSTGNEGLLNIEVQLMNMDEQNTDMKMTSSEGEYTFEEVSYYHEYAVEPFKNDDSKNGVSTLDLVMIQRHILGLTELDSPYKLVAADVNGNDQISASDLLLMRKVILGIQTDFGDNTSWRFIPTTFEIEDPENPFGFPEKVILNELYVSDMEIDFTAIKTGDINGNATTNYKSGIISESREAGKSIMANDQSFEVGTTLDVPVFANELESVIGMQFTIEYDASTLAYAGITGSKTDIQAYNVNAVNGMITISWNAAQAISLSADDELFVLNFKANASGDLSDKLTIVSSDINAEAYDQDLNIYDLSLEFGTRDNNEVSSTSLYQNSPNPFKGMTTIGFDLEERGLATLAIFDIAGKELYRISSEFDSGHNEMIIDVNSFNASSGILFYTLKAGDFVDTKKMILID